MRAHLVTSVAANIVTKTPSASAPGSNDANAASGDDGFAAMLGDVVQGSDKATAAKPAPSPLAIPKDQDIDSTGKPTGVTPASPAATNDNDLASLVRSASDDTTAPPPNDKASAIPVKTANSARPRGNTQADPAQVAGGQVSGGQAADNTPAASQTCDPNLAQMLATQQPVPADVTQTATPSTPGTTPDATARSVTAAPAAAAQPAADALSVAETLPATDVAAASVLGGGATTKAAKPGDDKPARDSEKSQAQGSTAATLADIGKAATRNFTDRNVSSAPPIHTAADTGKNNGQNNSQSDGQSGGSPPGQQSNASAPSVPNGANPAPATAADASPVNAAAAPAHVQAAPQPDAVSAANAAGTATPPTPAASSPAVAVQIQISHPTAAAPDLNTLAFTIAAKSEAGARHFDIRLDPAELGRVDVRLTVDDAGKAQATLSVEKPQTLALLQKDSGHLERALKDAGLDLSQNGLSFSLKGQQQQNGSAGERAATPRGRNLTARAIAAVDNAASITAMGNVSSGDTRLDIRV